MPRADLDEVIRLAKAGDLDGAVIAVEAVLASHPRDPSALAHLGAIQLRRGRLEEAAEAVDQAEAAGGATAFTSRLRGDLAYRSERWAAAARAYQAADALGDRRTWTLVQLGRARLHLGDLDGARGAAARAVERDDGAAPAWALLGDIARRSDDLEEAEAMYAKAHQRAPGDQWAHARLVEVRLTRMPPEQRAREVKVLRKSGGVDNPHLTAVLARLRSEEGDEAAAAEVWKERVDRRGDFYARKMHGFSLRRAGKLDEAAAVLGGCVQERPEDLILFRTYVHLQHQRGATEELRRALEGALPRAGNRRGAIYGELRKLPQPDPAPPAAS